MLVTERKTMTRDYDKRMLIGLKANKASVKLNSVFLLSFRVSVVVLFSSVVELSQKKTKRKEIRHEMSSSLPSLKGVRSRYRNTLDKEMTNAVAIIGCDKTKVNKEICRSGGIKCSKLLQTYIGKLEEHMDKFGSKLGEDETEFLENLLEEDSQLIYKSRNGPN